MQFSVNCSCSRFVNSHGKTVERIDYARKKIEPMREGSQIEIIRNSHYPIMHSYLAVHINVQKKRLIIGVFSSVNLFLQCIIRSWLFQIICRPPYAAWNGASMICTFSRLADSSLWNSFLEILVPGIFTVNCTWSKSFYWQTKKIIFLHNVI